MIRYLRSIKKRIVSALKEPATKKLLKNIGKEAVSTSSDLLFEKVKGTDNFGASVEKRLKQAQKRITESIKEGKNLRKGYNRLQDSETEDSSADEYLSQRNLKKRRKYNSSIPYHRLRKKSKKPTPSKLKRHTSKKSDLDYQSVFE